jgi:hypothetical protein
LGIGALQINTTGSFNTSLGTNALLYNNGDQNIAVGSAALQNNTSGNLNTALGFSSNTANTSGSENTSLGHGSLSTNTTGSSNTAIGAQSNVAANNLTNATALGYQATVAASNSIQLGNSNVTNVNTSGTITAPIIGVGTTAPASSAALEISSTTRGFLPPRMTAAQRDDIASPEQGLVVYCTNCGTNGELEVFNGVAWVNLLGNAAQATSSSSSSNSPYAYSFAATYNGSGFTYSTNKFDGTTWTNVGGTPMSDRGGVYIGQLNNTYYSYVYTGSGYSTYAFNGTSWSQVSTTGTGPTDLYGGYMGVFNNKIYNSGYDGNGFVTYSFDGTAWATVSTSGTPPSNGIIEGYLGTFNNISYFNGYNGGYNYSLNSFDGTTWTTISSSSNNNFYRLIGQIGNTSYLGQYDGSNWVYATFNGTSFSSWTPIGLPSGTNSYNLSFVGVINNKIYTSVRDNSTGTQSLYSLEGNTFTNLSNISNPGSIFGGFNCYMCNALFIGGNLK